MIFYFSGVAGTAEMAMLQEAGASRVLVDQFDLDVAAHWPGSIALDSGAYRVFRSGGRLDVLAYLDRAVQAGRPFDFVTAPDVIGDADATLRNWHLARSRWCGDSRLLPVWPWGAPQAHLELYLDQAEIVGIGGLVPLLRQRRDKDISDKAERQAANEARYPVLDQLVSLCAKHPQRTHLFGLCWPEAIEALWHLAYSADSSSWLGGARNGEVIYTDTRTGYLARTNAAFLPFAKAWDRQRRCVESARALLSFEPVTYRCPNGCSLHPAKRIPHRKALQKCGSCQSPLSKCSVVR